MDRHESGAYRNGQEKSAGPIGRPPLHYFPGRRILSHQCFEFDQDGAGSLQDILRDSEPH
jgi:hypothetical protein